jgi:hypothetical protein
MGDCPVDAPAMLAVAPGGLGSGCVSFGMVNPNYNLGRLQLSQSSANLLSILAFGVAGATPGSPTVGQVIPAAHGRTQEFAAPLDWQWLISYEAPTAKLYEDICGLLTHTPRQFFACLGPYYQTFVVDPGPLLLAHITMELAGTPSDFSPPAFAGTGPVLTMPVKFQIENLVLGKNCFVGSDHAPIVLHLVQTSAPDDVLTSSDPNGYPVTLSETSGSNIVATGFSEPKATGCGPAGILDGFVDGRLGLPSPASANSFSAEGDSITAWTTAGGSVLSAAWHAQFG